MKARHLVSFAVITMFALPVSAAQKWAVEHVKEFRFRDGVPGEEFRVVVQPKQLEELVSFLQRATDVGKGDGRRKWPKSFDIVGQRPESGRWLYDPATGEFSRLDPLVHRVYRFSESDRAVVNAYFEEKG